MIARNHVARFALVAGAALLFASAAPRTGPDDGDDPKKEDEPKPSITDRFKESEAAQQVVELFGKVETKLYEIDTLLWDASAGEGSLEDMEDAGIDDLLKATRESGRQAMEAIDEILKIAAEQQRQQSQSQSQSQSQDQQGQQPPDSRSQENDQPGERERTPEADSSQQEQQQEQQGQPEQHEGPETPSTEDENNPSAGPRLDPLEHVDPSRDAERWGELPQRVRELFRTEGGGDLPAQYRDWIDAYYRRLNRVD